VPPFMEEVPVAKVGEPQEAAEPEEEVEAPVEEPTPEPVTPASKEKGRRSQAEILAEAGLARKDDGGGDGAPEDSGADDTAETPGQPVGAASDREGPAQRDKSSKRRRQRGRRRKHGRPR
jgi:hypothetical protein